MDQPVLLFPDSCRLGLGFHVAAIPAIHSACIHPLHARLGLTAIPRCCSLGPAAEAAAEAGALLQAAPSCASCQVLSQACVHALQMPFSRAHGANGMPSENEAVEPAVRI